MPVSEEIKKWVIDNHNAGFTPEQLKESLVEAGYDPAAVDEVMGVASGPVLPPVHVKKGINWTIILVIVILGLFVGALLLFNRVIGSLLTVAPAVRT